jgi:hypothetical protein
MKRSRLQLLDHLHEYWTNGNFPDHSGLTKNENPCFIDNLGRVSAIGYLIVKSHGDIIDKPKVMTDEDIINWVSNSGFTKEEAAIIQPSYDRKNKS